MDNIIFKSPYKTIIQPTYKLEKIEEKQSFKPLYSVPKSNKIKTIGGNKYGFKKGY